MQWAIIIESLRALFVHPHLRGSGFEEQPVPLILCGIDELVGFTRNEVVGKATAEVAGYLSPHHGDLGSRVGFIPAPRARFPFQGPHTAPPNQGIGP